jgi:ribosomal protein S18 acetylase RimI-like enzyme
MDVIDEADHTEENDRVPVRTLTSDDLEAMTRIDRRITGRSRRNYLELKLREATEDSHILVSLGAEQDGNLVGYLMGRVYHGEFGVSEPTAIIDTIGVDPDQARHGIGRALYAQFARNMNALGIDRIQTQADWNDWQLLQFLEQVGFRPAPRITMEARLDE